MQWVSSVMSLPVKVSHMRSYLFLLLTWKRNLALPQPSYASIASHEVSNIAQEPELPSREEVIALKSGKTLPMVVNVEEKTDFETDLKDPEGFEEVLDICCSTR